MSPRVCLKILSSSFVIPGCAFLEWGPRPAYNYKFNNDPESRRLTALPTQSRLFKTVSIALPASRFLREHLRQNDLIWACTSRIHAQVPVITTGQLAKTLRQQVSRGIDIAVVVCPAPRPTQAYVLKAHARTAASSLESRVVCAAGEEVLERSILVAQTLRQNCRRHFGEPLMSCRALPL